MFLMTNMIVQDSTMEANCFLSTAIWNLPRNRIAIGYIPSVSAAALLGHMSNKSSSEPTERQGSVVKLCSRKVIFSKALLKQFLKNILKWTRLILSWIIAIIILYY